MESFPEQVFDVTNCFQGYALACCCIVTRQTLDLQSEEAVLRASNCCCSTAQRRPYAQLNIIERRSQCFGLCEAINSDLAPMNEKGEGGIVPGCGCDGAKVRSVVEALNRRKNGRGKVAQMRQQNYMLDNLSKVAVQMPLLLKHYGVEYPPDGETLARLFGDSPPTMKLLKEVAERERLPEFMSQEYDVTNCCQVLTCTRKDLKLGPDEAEMTTKQCITGSVVTTQVPYANIDSVDAVNTCGCCAVLNAGELTQPPGSVEGGQPVSPGCGCSKDLVEAIRTDLQQRIDIRGNLGQMKQLEKMMSKYGDLAAELPLILDELGADTAYPPSQETMMQVYGAGGSAVPPATTIPHAAPSQAFETKRYNVRNEFQNCASLYSSCCLAGCTRKELVLEPEQVVMKTSNNCMTSIERKPYAQLGSVDEASCCFCCISVNGLYPGFGCSRGKVREIARELQARKVGRGNIAQLRNQENTLVKAIEVDIRMDILLQNQGIAFPPSQEQMTALYGASPPSLPADNAQRGKGIHYEASRVFDTMHFDITNAFGVICGCCLRTTLELNDEEAIFRFRSCCAQATRREPYAQLGSVEPGEICCGICTTLQTDQNFICPGCGCSNGLVTTVANELQERKVKRGNIAQIKQQENLMMELIKLAVKTDLLAKKEGIQYPPSQATMDDVFGQGFTLPFSGIPAPSAPRPSVTLINVTIPSGLQPGAVFQARGPTGSFSFAVPRDAVPGQTVQVPMPSRRGSTETELQPFRASQ